LEQLVKVSESKENNVQYASSVSSINANFHGIKMKNYSLVTQGSFCVSAGNVFILRNFSWI